MKKIIITVLATITALTMTACGGTANGTSSTSSASSTSSTSSTVSTSSAAPTASYEKGTVTDNVYKSSFLGMQYTAPSKYTMSTEEKMMELTTFANGIEYKDAEKKQVDYSKAALVCEMETISDEIAGPTVVQLLSFKLDKDYSAEEFFTSFIDEGEGFGKPSKETIAGQEYTGYCAVVGMGGPKFAMEFLLRKQDDRMVCISMSYPQSDSSARETLLSGFAKPY